MKVTALIPDRLVEEVRRHAKTKNLTQSLMVALREWLAMRKIARLNKTVQTHPLEFTNSFSASRIRAQNRRR